MGSVVIMVISIKGKNQVTYYIIVEKVIYSDSFSILVNINVYSGSDNNKEEKYIDRVFELFKDKSKTFDRVFGISIGFFLLFFFIIFIPYVSLVDINNENLEEKYKINKFIDEYANANHTLQTFLINLNNFPNSIIQSIKTLFSFEGYYYAKCSQPSILSPLLFQIKGESKDDVLSFSHEERDILKSCIKVKFTTTDSSRFINETGFGIHFYNSNLSKNVNDNRNYSAYVSYPSYQNDFSPVLNFSVISLLPYYECGIFPNKLIDFVCNVDKKTDDLINQLNQTLYGVNWTFLVSDNQLSLFNNLSQFEEHLKELNGDYSVTFLNSRPRLMNESGIINDERRFYDIMIPIFENVNNHFLNDSPFYTFNQTVTERLNQLQIRKSILEENLQNIEKQLNETSSRLDEIQSPIGKLPIGLVESIFLFPLALSIGFLIYSFLLVGTIRLRGEIHQQYKMLKKNVTVVAPLWIDPIKIKDSKSLLQLHWEISKLIVYFIPIVIFGITLFFIFDIRESITHNDNISFYNKEIIQQMLNILYIIAIGMIGYGSLILLIEIHNYNKLDKENTVSK